MDRLDCAGALEQELSFDVKFNISKERALKAAALEGDSIVTAGTSFLPRDIFDKFAANILEATAGVRFTRNSEKEFQNQLEALFKAHKFHFDREHKLNDKDKPDFYFYDVSIALEVKVKGNMQSHLRQCKRYADSLFVDGVILIAMRPYDVPSTLSDKPFTCLNFAPKCL